MDPIHYHPTLTHIWNHCFWQELKPQIQTSVLVCSVRHVSPAPACMTPLLGFYPLEFWHSVYCFIPGFAPAASSVLWFLLCLACWILYCFSLDSFFFFFLPWDSCSLGGNAGCLVIRRSLVWIPTPMHVGVSLSKILKPKLLLKSSCHLAWQPLCELVNLTSVVKQFWVVSP